MESYAKNKQLHIDKEALYSLALVQEGLLYPTKGLANKQIFQTMKDSDTYFSSPFVLNPSGKRNQEVIQSAQTNQILDIVVENHIVGYIQVEEVFTINKQDRIKQLGGGTTQTQAIQKIQNRLGEYAIYGQYKVKCDDVKKPKQNLQDKIKQYQAKKITAIILDGSVFHRAYEKLIRDELESSDLVVIFLLKPYTDTIIDYELRRKCLDFALEHFLINERVCIIPLDDTYLFMSQNKILLHAIIAKNYDCTHFVANEAQPNLSMFYHKNIPHSILDEIKGIQTKIKPNYAYCNVCKMLINNITCSHGHHHQINYNTESILEFYQLGLLPPAILVRPEISAIILSSLYPNRFSNLQKLYYDLVPLNDGILTQKNEQDFYIELMRLYQTSALT
ncbi:sulfate adenylyltransferase [Helicobacter fennelliae]|uniref:sulfate adenylyltransferase n=1 Tax=Helicobacter fennelliae TaxID=215 RepID=UPI000DF9AA56|nr:sulfate adenylyltransferase [Helicobacter fennelliae]STQ84118.1 sulfate adenylyltransferase [Helicobacter fennelliae]